MASYRGWPAIPAGARSATFPMTDHTHTFDHWPFADKVSAAAFCTGKVFHERFPVLQVTHDGNGDWQFLDATSDDLGEPVLVCLGCVFERDPSLAQIADLPRGWSAFREHPGAQWERWETEADEEDGEDEDHCAHDGDAKALSDIETYGLHVISVREEGEQPPFSYSIGIERSLGMPELIVIGLRASVAHAAINACYDQMRSGTQIAPGSRVADLLGGDFKCLIGEVDPIHYRDYMGWALWLYEGPGFRAHQIIYPTTSGVFPWEPEAGEWFRRWQPLLAVSATA